MLLAGFLLVFLFLLSYGDCEDHPMNVVAVLGSSVLLNCSKSKPFRWYRYLPSALSDDKVIFKGPQMADDADKRFRVLKTPNAYPFDRLDLSISDVQMDLAGTYKCLASSRVAYCAELVVLYSEPVCDSQTIPNNSSEGGIILSCSLIISSNSEVEMFCRKDSNNIQEEANCSSRYLGVESVEVSCSLNTVVDWQNDSYKCEVRLNHKPLQRYTSCHHDSNKPEYSYVRLFSPSDLSSTTEPGAADSPPTALRLSTNDSMSCQDLQMILMVGFSLAGTIIILLVIAVICLARKILRRKEGERYEMKTERKTSAIEPPPPSTYTPLDFQQYEEIPVATYLSANPQFSAAPYESIRAQRQQRD